MYPIKNKIFDIFEYRIIPSSFGSNYVEIVGLVKSSMTKSIRHLIIPSKIEELPVFRIGVGAFMDNHFIEEVHMPDTINLISSAAFQHCTALENIHFSENLMVIMSDAFRCCHKLKQIILPDSVIEIDERAFSECGMVTKLKLSKNLKRIRANAFDTCFNIEELNIPSSLEYIGDSAFARCYNIKQLQMPCKVEKIGNYAFSYCKALTNVTLPPSLKSVNSNSFYKCPIKYLLVGEIEDVSLAKFVCNFTQTLKKIKIISDISDRISNKYLIQNDALYYWSYKIGNWVLVRFLPLSNLTSFQIPAGIPVYDLAFEDCDIELTCEKKGEIKYIHDFNDL